MKIRHLLKTALLFCAPLLWLSCSSWEDVAAPDEFGPVKITSVSLDSANIGDRIVITGENFLKEKEYNLVWFTPEISATIDSSTSTKLFLKVPEGALSGRIIVSNAVYSDTSKKAFVVLKISADSASPVITDFSPKSGISGTIVTLTGRKFGFKKEESKIYFGAIQAEVLEAADSVLKVRAPFNSDEVNITINVHGKTAAASGVFETIPRGHSIFFFSPILGVVGQEITVRISVPIGDTNGIVVKFGSIPALIKSIKITQDAKYYDIVATVPYGAVTAPVSVSLYGDNVSSPSDFNIQIPVINSFSPKEALPGTPVTIKGSGFGYYSQYLDVYFGNTKAVVSSIDMYTLIVLVPSRGITGKITVQSKGHQSISNEVFKVLEPPIIKITSIEPMSGYTDLTHITIKGENFSSAPDSITINFGNASVQVYADSKTQSVTLVLPKNATSAPVCISSPRGKVTCSQDEFKVLKENNSTATISFDGIKTYHSWFSAEGTNGGGTSSNGSDTSIIKTETHIIKNCPDPYPNYVKNTFSSQNACYPGQGMSIPIASLADTIFHCLIRGGYDNRFIYDGIEITIDSTKQIINSLKIYHSEFLTTYEYQSVGFLCVKRYIQLSNVAYKIVNGKKYIKLSAAEMQNSNMIYQFYDGYDSHSTMGSRYSRNGTEQRNIGLLPDAYFEMTLE